MSDYIYMLESHLNPDQNRAVAEVQAAAGAAGLNLFLAGGALRDMLGGYRIRDLDFRVEGPSAKVAKAVEKAGAELLTVDEARKAYELRFPSGVLVEIAMCRTETVARTGAKPRIAPATIQEDLRGRDFTINAIAISLNRASRGLLIDPTNGHADLTNRELRTISNYAFLDDPVRLLRLIRFKARFGFTIEERTRNSYGNAREAEVEKLIPAEARLEELRRIAEESTPSEALRELEAEKLSTLFAPTLEGAKLNLAGFTRMEKMLRLLEEAGVQAERLPLFLYVLTEKLTPKDRAGLQKATGMKKAEAESGAKLEARARKLEQGLRSAKIRRPSDVYFAVQGHPADEIAFVLYHSANKTVQERLRNYLQKYLPASQELTEADYAGIAHKPGTPKYAKARQDILTARLNRRAPKPVPEAAVAAAPAPPPPPILVQTAGRARAVK